MNDYNSENKTMRTEFVGLSQSNENEIKLPKDKKLIIYEVLEGMGYGFEEYPGCVDKMLEEEDQAEYSEFVRRVNKLSKEREVD